MDFQTKNKPKQNDPIIVRKGVVDDLPSVLDLVKELAYFEKAPEEVSATLDDYIKDFQSGWFEIAVALHENQIIGMAFYYKTYSTWKGKMYYLEDLIVKEAWRSHGVGQKLFSYFLEEAKNQGGRLTKWQVLDWNEGAIRFYKRNDAVFESEWLNGKITFNEK